MHIFLQRINIYDALFLVFLGIVITISIITFDHPLSRAAGDASQNYLMAHNTVAYGDFSFLGPYNAGFGSWFISSPAYFYLLSLILLIKDSFVFLQLANILLQVFTVVLVYFLVKKMFGPVPALMATLLFGFNPHTLRLYEHIWQPSAMQPFLMLSYFLLFLFYRNKRYIFMAASIVSFVFAGALHNSAFVILPAMLIIVFFLLYKQQRASGYYLGTILITIGSAFLLYLSPIVLSIKNNFNSFSTFRSENFTKVVDIYLIQALQNLPTRLYETTSMALSFFLHSTLLDSILLWILIPTVFIYFFIYKKDERRYFLLTTIFLAGGFILFASFFPIVQEHYLVPILALFAVVVAESIYRVFSFNKYFRTIGLIIIFLILYTSSQHFSFIYAKQNTPSNFSVLSSVTNTIKDEILYIQEKEGLPDLNFFYIEAFEKTQNFSSPAILLIPLEKELGRQLTKAGSHGGFTQLNEKRYIFLACFNGVNFFDDSHKCKETFFKKYPTHTFVKEIYNGKLLSVFLFSKY